MEWLEKLASKQHADTFLLRDVVLKTSERIRRRYSNLIGTKAASKDDWDAKLAFFREIIAEEAEEVLKEDQTMVDLDKVVDVTEKVIEDLFPKTEVEIKVEDGAKKDKPEDKLEDKIPGAPAEEKPEDKKDKFPNNLGI
jgi:hypothetical protein